LDENLLDEVLGSKDYEKLLSADVFDEAAEVKVQTFDDEDMRPKRNDDD